MRIPDYYIEEKFFEHVGHPTKTGGGNMIGCCPFCMEGKSWGKKKRFTYYADKQAMVCFNCGESHNPISFIKKIEGIDFKTLMKNMGEEDSSFTLSKKKHVFIEEPKEKIKLPEDYINLFDQTQIEFYSDNELFNAVHKEISRRRLNTGVNRGDLWFSLTDWLHKNRIIIPFYAQNGNLEFYQSRAMTKRQEDEYGKYISSMNGSKTFWGINKIDHQATNIFMFEGPLDCFFVKNSFGGGGTKLNSNQLNTLDMLQLIHNVVICLDNDFKNDEVVELYEEYIKKGYDIFMWGGDFENVKDINEYCIENEVDEVTEDQIMEHVYSGSEAVKMLNKKRTPKNECPSSEKYAIQFPTI